MEHSKRALLFLLLSMILAGCSGLQTFSNSARTGDTVAVALQGADGIDYIAAEDLTARLLDSNGVYHNLWIENVVRVFADPLSEAAMSDMTFPHIGAKYESEWMAMITLSDADAGVLYPNIATGSATIEITHPSLTFFSPQLNILAGQGSRHQRISSDGLGNSLDYKLRAAPHIGVVNNGITSEQVAGGTFVFEYDATQFPTNNRPLRAVKLSQDPNIQLLSSTTDLGGNIRQLKVVIVNPNGFTATKSVVSDFTVDGKSLLRDMAFVLTWALSITADDYNPQIPGDLTLVSSEIIDIYGDPVLDLQVSFSSGYGYQ